MRGGGEQHAVVSVAQVVYHSERSRHANTRSGIHECARSIHFLLFLPSPSWSEFKYNFIAFVPKALSCIISPAVVRTVSVGLAKLSRDSNMRVAQLKLANFHVFFMCFPC